MQVDEKEFQAAQDIVPPNWFYAKDGKHYYFCETTGEGFTIGEMTEDAYIMQTDYAAVIDLTVV
ncbi:MAG: hypothetical protein RML35_00690 [Chloroherpetonaceae bacterium]|nr:hypothetical protein [Chloroherpetonaceae bacterium]